MNYAFITLGDYFKSNEAESFFFEIVYGENNDRAYFKNNANLEREKISGYLKEKEIECLVIETFDNEASNRKQRKQAIANILTILTYRPRRVIFIPKQVNEFVQIIKEWGGEHELFTYNAVIDKQPRKLIL